MVLETMSENFRLLWWKLSPWHAFEADPERIYNLSGHIGKVVASHAEGCRVNSLPSRDCTNLYCARGTQRVLPMSMGGATSQLDLLSLMPLSITSCGQLQLGVPRWSTSVALLQVVDNWPKLILILELLAIENFTFYLYSDCWISTFINAIIS